MKTLHLSIIIGAAVAAAAAGGLVFLAGHSLQTEQESSTEDESESALVLDLSLNSTDIRPGQEMGMDISLTNTSPKTLVLDPDHNWPLRKWSMGPCLFHLPFGMALMKGNYGANNMTDGQRLTLYPRGVYLCKPVGISGFVFDPSSSTGIIETHNSTRQATMKYHVAFNGYYEGQRFVPLGPGIYTVVGDDQWGHVVVRHFSVAG
ncbi:MAG: hypothetical protein KGI33_11495 [Thaumarchaeota archaeon]|nr:hypothetical protein [Nitrososphaerota archaeon]